MNAFPVVRPRRRDRCLCRAAESGSPFRVTRTALVSCFLSNTDSTPYLPTRIIPIVLNVRSTSLFREKQIQLDDQRLVVCRCSPRPRRRAFGISPAISKATRQCRGAPPKARGGRKTSEAPEGNRHQPCAARNPAHFRENADSSAATPAEPHGSQLLVPRDRPRPRIRPQAGMSRRPAVPSAAPNKSLPPAWFQASALIARLPSAGRRTKISAPSGIRQSSRSPSS